MVLFGRSVLLELISHVYFFASDSVPNKKHWQWNKSFNLVNDIKKVSPSNSLLKAKSASPASRGSNVDQKIKSALQLKLKSRPVAKKKVGGKNHYIGQFRVAGRTNSPLLILGLFLPHLAQLKNLPSTPGYFSGF